MITPKGWTVAKIGEISETINPGFPSGRHNAEERGVPHIRPMNISRNGAIDLSVVKYVEVDNYSPLLAGDVLFNNTNSPELVGKTTYIKQNTNWAFSNHMTRIRPRPELVTASWLANVLHYLYVVGYFKLNCRHHVNQASISSGYLANNVEIPVPPLPEQERIVERIESLFTQLDAGVAGLKRAKAALKRYKASVLKAAVAGKLLESNPNIEEGCLPKGWTWMSPSEFCTAVESGSTPKPELMTSGKGEIPFIKVYNLKFDGTMDFSVKPTFISKETQNTKLSRSKVFPGDVLTNIVGPPLGKVSIVPNIYPEWNMNQAVVLFRTGKSVINQYLSYVLQSPDFIKRIKATSKATAGQYNVSLTTCRKIPMPIPPLEEQQFIVSEVESRLSVVAELDQIVTLNLKRAARLRQAILKRAFEGRLVEQNPEDKQFKLPTTALKSSRQLELFD